jgi:GR25 family glycosyltransferase involved in LPS biosynthesis
MTFFEEFFGGNIFVINLARRPDRLANFTKEMDHLGIKFERFEAIDAGPGDGNRGCCASHKALNKLIADRGLRAAMIFEDDSVVVPEFRDTFHNEVVPPLRELPENWDAIYLGGGYGDDPQGWHSRHLVRINWMKTTSSYGVTLKTARGLAEYIPHDCAQGIDDMVSGYLQNRNAFISEPRFFIQYNNYSDLQRAVLDNGQSMMDVAHVNRIKGKRP